MLIKHIEDIPKSDTKLSHYIKAVYNVYGLPIQTAMEAPPQDGPKRYKPVHLSVKHGYNVTVGLVSDNQWSLVLGKILPSMRFSDFANWNGITENHIHRMTETVHWKGQGLITSGTDENRRKDGFILCDAGLRCFRSRTDEDREVPHVVVTEAIGWGAQGASVLTIKLALWYLCMLAAEDLTEQYHTDSYS
jgi:hypothetical protein